MAAERGKSGHPLILPDESTASVPRRCRHGKEVETTPILLQRIDVVRFGDTDDYSVEVMIGPFDSTVGTPQCPEVGGGDPVGPQSCVLGPVAQQSGSAGNP